MPNMFFWNRHRHEREAQAAEQARQKAAAQDTERLRLGNILFKELKALAEQNTQVDCGTISAGYLNQNDQKYSVIILHNNDSRSEAMMQFDIDVAGNCLSIIRKYRDGPEFTVDDFDKFLETAKKMVRDFK